jgi:DNA-binding beta-propeller fold protein YncE
MRKHTQAATALVAAAVTVLATAGIAQAAGAPHTSPRHPKQVTVRTQKVISLPGVGGHGDVVTVDPAAHTAYIAHSPDDDVVVLDTVHNTIKTVIPGIPSANGIAYTADYVFVASAPTNSVKVISKATWKIIDSVPSGGKTPDAIYSDPHEHSVFVVNDDTSTMEEFSATAPFTVLGTLALPPSATGSHTGPDLGTYVAANNRIYQAVDNQVLVIDPKTRTITHAFTLPLPAGSAAKDMYYDASRHLLWVATSSPEVLALNPQTGRVLYTVKTLSGADQIAGDPDRGLLFVGEGQAGVMGVIDLATHSNIANVATEAGFHTLDYLPHKGIVYAYYNKSNTIHVDKITMKWAEKPKNQ